MFGASKEGLLGCDSLISKGLFSFDCLKCMYYILVIVFLFRNLHWNTLKIHCKVSFRSLIFVLKLLKRLVLFGNESVQDQF